MNDNAVPFDDLRRVFCQHGFAAKLTAKGWVFEHPKEGLVVFRAYTAQEPIGKGDLVTTRKFLDYRGILDARAFDAELLSSKPA